MPWSEYYPVGSKHLRKKSGPSPIECKRSVAGRVMLSKLSGDGVGANGEVTVRTTDVNGSTLSTITIPLAEPLRTIGDVKDEICIQNGQYGILRRINDDGVLTVPTFTPFELKDQSIFLGLVSAEERTFISVEDISENLSPELEVFYPGSEESVEALEALVEGAEYAGYKEGYSIGYGKGMTAGYEPGYEAGLSEYKNLVPVGMFEYDFDDVHKSRMVYKNYGVTKINFSMDAFDSADIAGSVNIFGGDSPDSIHIVGTRISTIYGSTSIVTKSISLVNASTEELYPYIEIILDYHGAQISIRDITFE